jgi:hypothetical protein
MAAAQPDAASAAVTSGRRAVSYDTLDPVLADVDRLRGGGYVEVGRWTQACWHLRSVTEALLARPVIGAMPEMLTRRPMMDAVPAGGPLPTVMPCPPEFAPPADVEPAEVDRFLAHRANHCSHLVPTSGAV